MIAGVGAEARSNRAWECFCDVAAATEAGMLPVPSAVAPHNPDAAFKLLRRVCEVVCTFFLHSPLLLTL
ncbi:unnamed protein product [Euphydryas editha]|uniref:Uncharacterized protein n=1 Tax=Euphydryas editha TaxID=104508 RepID=A0AAU9UTL3_EUPED|nr:unnamed protein product [Euphydryas editha]